jgi:hypothetical protein
MERKNPAGITSNPAYFMALSFRLGSRQVTGWTAAYRTEVGCGGPQGMNDLLKKSVFEAPLRILKHLIVTIRLRERDGPSVGYFVQRSLYSPEAAWANSLKRAFANSQLRALGRRSRRRSFREVFNHRLCTID